MLECFVPRKFFKQVLHFFILAELSTALDTFLAALANISLAKKSFLGKKHSSLLCHSRQGRRKQFLKHSTTGPSVIKRLRL
jgi:hypothetical protein